MLDPDDYLSENGETQGVVVPHLSGPPVKYFDEITATASAEENKLVPLNPDAPGPKTLCIVPHLDALPNADAYEYPLAEAETLLGIRFTETYWLPQGVLSHFRDKIERNKVRQPHIINPPYSKLLIAHMGDMYGYGLFARTQILSNEFVFCYYGKLVYPEAGQKFLHGLIANDSIFHPRKNGVIDATYYRNFAAFSQHLPTTGELFNYRFMNAEVRSSVATANIEIPSSNDVYHQDGLMCHRWKAKTKIDAGEIIGFSYGVAYWLSQGRHPHLFNRRGVSIDPHLYYPEYLYLQKSPNTPDQFQQFKTEKVFSGLIHRTGMGDFNFKQLLDTTKEHLGEERLKAHLQCFIKMNPEVAVNYRVQRFFIKHHEYNPVTYQSGVIETGSKQTAANLGSYLSKFGFICNMNPNAGIQVELSQSTPKTPLSFLK